MLVIDRFEGEWAIVEYNKSTFNIPKTLLPEEAKEGDVLKVTIEIDKQATKKSNKKINGLIDDAFE
ncbi:MAG: DUF3006 domain-containing protein [Firmicutes bacterium]|nr:DUF3006 domain-containing protein [Bacillota bacterium]